MAGEISVEEYKKAYREVRKEREKRGFIIHLAVYIIVNIGLITCNLVYVPERIWFFWPLIFWGLGLICHYLGGVRFLEKELERDEALAEIRVRGRK
ncbi:MAG TPA: 2TM domain-containing protein [bacterium (Candidatus Stahlbacteria)]|nr:2TM domain-containing protein [Candidatus Stahlbacteria bacterium]